MGYELGNWEPFVSGLVIGDKNQSTERADGGVCLKFYRPLELTGIRSFLVPGSPLCVCVGGGGGGGGGQGSGGSF